MFTRRDFLKRSSLIALAPTVPDFLARSLRADAATTSNGRVLVVIQLDGGNDGLNTVVPFADEAYARYRKELRLPMDRLIKVNETVGLHPAMADAGKLLESGRLAIVQGVGYPNPDRSHFRSMAIWHTARFDPEEQNSFGWLGRGLDGDTAVSGAPTSLLIGTGSPPVAVRGRRSVVSALERLEDYSFSMAPPSCRRPLRGRLQTSGGGLAGFVQRSLLDAYTTAERLKQAARPKTSGAQYPATGLAKRLALISQLLKAGFETRVYYTIQDGYDTHAGQASTHYNLLNELSGALRAFLDDLAAAGLIDRVAVLAFSEFSRTVKENGSAGTDHGTAGPVFIAGAKVKAGLHGTAVSLTNLEQGEPKMTTDFRRVYATVLKDWLGLAAAESLSGTFEPLPLFRI